MQILSDDIVVPMSPSRRFFCMRAVIKQSVRIKAVIKSCKKAN
jgi:hypothetical protein